MLILHEEILIQFKLFLRDPHPKRGHHRWSSGDSASKGFEGMKNDAHKSRRSLESLWTRHSNNAMPTATPNEAADIVKIFGGMVSASLFTPHFGLKRSDASVLYL